MEPVLKEILSGGVNITMMGLGAFLYHQHTKIKANTDKINTLWKKVFH